MKPARQLSLALPARASQARADFIEDASNAEALAWLDTPARWPQGRFCLHGPIGSGKSHLLAAMAAAQGWQPREAASLRGLPEAPTTGVILDDADAVPEEAALFHLINQCGERGLPLLLAARAAPARWPVALPDLASRLRATAAAGLREPSDALLEKLLAKHFADRQLRPAPEVATWLLARLPRRAAALAEAVARLDRAALAARHPLTIPFARAVLDLDDGFGSHTDDCSPPGPALL